MSKFARYVFVQFIAYGIDIGVFTLFLSWFEAGPVISNFSGKVCAGIFAFWLHSYFTFESGINKKSVDKALKYFIFLFINSNFSVFVFVFFSYFIELPWAAKIIADLFCVSISYFLSSRFIFLKDRT